MKILTTLVALILCVSLTVYLSNKAQVYLLYKLYSFGSGFDDGATELFIKNKQRYKSTVLDLLNAELPGSYQANASFVFGELLINDPDINNKIYSISNNHANQYIRCFWHDILNARFEHVKVVSENSDKFTVFYIKDQGSKCE